MIEIYRYNVDNDDKLSVVATFHDDGTVSGNSFEADRLRNVIDGMDVVDPDADSNLIEVVIQLRYNNAAYTAERE